MKNLLLHGEVRGSGFKSENTGNTYNAVVSFADRTDKNGNAKIGFTMRFEDKTKRQSPLAMKRRFSLFVVITAGNNIKLTVLDLVDKPVSIVDSAAPVATQVVFQRFGFT